MTWGYIEAISARNTRVTLVLDRPIEPVLAVADGATQWLWSGVIDGFATLNGYDRDGAQRCELRIPVQHVLALVKTPTASDDAPGAL